MTIKSRLGLSFTHAFNGNFGMAFKTLTVGNATYRGLGQFLDGFDYDPLNLCIETEEDVKKAYKCCPPLAAIIDKKTQNFILGKTWILDQNEAVVTSKKAQRITKLLAKPNKQQTKSEFESDLYRNIQLYGWCYVRALKPYGMSFDTSTELHVIEPSNIVDMEFTENLDVTFIHVRESLGTTEKISKYDAESLYLFKDIRPKFNNPLFPSSRTISLEMPINNIIGAYESRNTLVNSRGSLGMITNQTADATSFQPLKPNEKNELLRDYQKMKGTRRGQSHIIITSSDLKWQSMVMPTKDLMLFEEVEDSINRICDAYNFPSALYAKLNSDGANSTMLTSTTNLFQEAIVPESISIYEQMSLMFELEKDSWRLDKDYTHVAAMQKDAEKAALARLRRNQALQVEFKNNVITLNQWRVANGDDPKDDGDVYYSDIKELITVSYKQNSSTLESTFMEDDINPRQNAGDALNIDEDTGTNS